MLKITKGLKKKKKGKKGKRKEEELFEEAELEQYRREQEEKRRQQAEAGEGEGADKNEAKGEEWEKFKALTSGVDSILKKTQGDLDRIKSTSYFQRKPTPSELAAEQAKEAEKNRTQKKEKHWIGFGEGTVDLGDDLAEQLPDEGDKPLPVTEVTEAEELEDKKSEEEDEEDDDEEDIFDTSFVDAVASGEVKLAYIPDSPPEEEDGFDPFDTSIVDKVIKEDPTDKKKRNLVSLGCAVEILTGKVDRPTTAPQLLDGKQKRSPRRQRQQDLLLGSFDEGEEEGGDQLPSKKFEEDQPIKTLLDDDPILGEEIKVDLSINLAPIVAVATPSPLTEIKAPIEVVPPIQSIVSEFDIIANDNTVKDNKLTNGQLENDNNIDDEFAVLAAESLTKEVHCVSPLTVQQESTNRKELLSENKSKPSRPPLPNIFFYVDPLHEYQNEYSKENNEDDPFDTSFAAEIVPGKYELKLIEEEILNKDLPAQNIPAVSINLPKSGSLKDPLAFDEHNLLDDAHDQIPLSFKHRDLLGGSTTDLSKIIHSPIEPALVSEKIEGELSYCDPFDTSVVNDLVAPGKAELKFLEKELLSEGPITNSQVGKVEIDDDFDPRAESPPRKKSIPRPEQLFIGDHKRQSIPKVVAFKVASPDQLPDLLSVGNSEISKASKPLTPYYPEPKILEETKLSCESEQDPFDTSFVSSTPGRLELKLIENELVGEVTLKHTTQTLKHSVSDPDFDPRSLEPSENKLQQIEPVTSLPTQIQTAIVEENFQISLDILSEEVQIDTKLHTPVQPRRIEEELELKNTDDPFDTSIALDILPGKAELKLLESELIDSDVQGALKRSYTDPNFDPRLIEEQKEGINPIDQPPKLTIIHKATIDLDLTEHPICEEIAEKPLTPLTATFTTQEEDIDPFDTSSVGDLIPGKVELKILESELIHN